MIKKIILGLSVIFLPFPVLAAPSVAGVSGIFTDGQFLKVDGIGFGSNPIDVEWLGGDNGLIESTNVGLTPELSGWFFGTQWAIPKITDDFAHSGSNSIKVITNSSSYNGDIRHDIGKNIIPGGKLFVSWWVRRTHVGSGQWKMFRLDYENDITDGPYQLNTFNWDSQQQFILRPGPTVESGLWQDWSPPFPSEDGKWYRLDLSIKVSSYSGADGDYSLSLHDPESDKPVLTETWTERTSFADSKGFYRWILWQNYTGNGISSQSTWMDDFFVQVGTWARVEIGDASTWSACTFREIQPAVAWADNSIEIRLNQGALPDGKQAYLYVVDANGNPNPNGYPIRLGGTVTPAYSRADVNHDNAITTADALLALRRSLGLSMTGTAWSDSLGNGDVDCSQSPTSADALLILRKSLGMSMAGTGWCE